MDVHRETAGTATAIARRTVEILHRAGVLSRDQAAEAFHAAQTRVNAPVEEVLFDRGFVDEATFAKTMSEETNLPLTDLHSVSVLPEHLRLLPPALVRAGLAVPIAVGPRSLTIAVANPVLVDHAGAADRTSVRSVHWVMAPHSQVRALLQAAMQPSNGTDRGHAAHLRPHAEPMMAEVTRAELKHAVLNSGGPLYAVGMRLCAIDLSNAGWLRSARLAHVDLREANLTGAHLEGADLSNADLRGARLVRANFRGALLRGAQVDGAHLTEAVLDDADLTGVDLSGTVR